MPEKKTRKVALFPGDFVNLGDAMLSLAAGRRIMRDHGHCTVMPYDRPTEKIRQEFEAAGLKVVSIRSNPLSALTACHRSAVRIGGGHAIRNEVSFGWLVFVISVAVRAFLSGDGVSIIGAGATAVRSRWKKSCFGLLFWLCREIHLRDGQSLEVLAADFPATAKKMTMSGDLAFLKGGVSLRTELQERCTCLISPGVDIRESRNEDPVEILGTLRELHERAGMRRVLIVSHDSRERFGLAFCKELAIAIRRELPVEVELVTTDGVEDGLLLPYGRARWIVTGRLHGLILGALQSCEVFYTAGSAAKLKPFADLFAFRPAGGARVEEMLEEGTLRLQSGVSRQQDAAELNFSERRA